MSGFNGNNGLFYCLGMLAGKHGQLKSNSAAGENVVCVAFYFGQHTVLLPTISVLQVTLSTINGALQPWKANTGVRGKNASPLDQRISDHRSSSVMVVWS
eukprot:gb/GECG01015417.1/.p1 GENE.gb/GECG01015417.1/~~gb/GECG01015417.1/.p1  ORF type:complete len:100 (+),score=7.39 gb/GECG01015417.1/:1-300(+)